LEVLSASEKSYREKRNLDNEMKTSSGIVLHLKQYSSRIYFRQVVFLGRWDA